MRTRDAPPTSTHCPLYLLLVSLPPPTSRPARAAQRLGREVAAGDRQIESLLADVAELRRRPAKAQPPLDILGLGLETAHPHPDGLLGGAPGGGSGEGGATAAAAAAPGGEIDLLSLA